VRQSAGSMTPPGRGVLQRLTSRRASSERPAGGMARSSGGGSVGGWQRCWSSRLLRRGNLAASLHDACDRARTLLVLDQLQLFLMCFEQGRRRVQQGAGIAALRRRRRRRRARALGCACHLHASCRLATKTARSRLVLAQRCCSCAVWGIACWSTKHGTRMTLLLSASVLICPPACASDCVHTFPQMDARAQQLCRLSALACHKASRTGRRKLPMHR